MENKQSTHQEGKRILGGLFADRQSTEKAYHELHQRGYTKDDIHVAMSDNTRKTHYSDVPDDFDTGSKLEEGVGTGSIFGAFIGAAAGVGAALLIPGFGLVVGPIAAGLMGMAGGGVTGAIVGGLIGFGIPEEHAELYHKGVTEGKVFLGVHPRSDEDAHNLEQFWKENKGEHVH